MELMWAVDSLEPSPDIPSIDPCLLHMTIIMIVIIQS